jgi:hypothetical protein
LQSATAFDRYDSPDKRHGFSASFTHQTFARRHRRKPCPKNTQQTYVDASFNPVIAWRVASQQSQPPFHRTSRTLRRFGFLIKRLLIFHENTLKYFYGMSYLAEVT